MFWLSFLGDFFRALRAGDSPGEIAGGFSFGYLIGLMPFFSLQGVLLMLVMFLVKVNLAAASIAILLTSFVAFLFDPLIHQLGYFLLTLPVLHGFWESLYNLPVAPLTRFYNTVALGSLAAGLLTVVPVYFGAKRLTLKYRATVQARIEKSKLVKAIKRSSLYEWYQRISRVGDLT